MDSNDTLKVKQNELNAKIAESKEIKKQLDYIKRAFNQDNNYDWMIETEARIRSDKTYVNKLKEENASLNKILEKHEKLLEESIETNRMSDHLDKMEQEMADMEKKMRTVNKKLAEEEKKFLE